MNKSIKAATFTRDSLRALQADMTTALLEVGKKHGIAISLGSTTFSSTTANIKVVAAVIGEGAAEDANALELKGAEEFKRRAVLYGLDPNWLQKTFKSPTSGELFVITGLNRRRSKNPIMARRASDGKPFIFPVFAVASAMRAAGVPNTNSAHLTVTSR